MTTTHTPSSMQNSIWYRPEFKKTKKNWSFKRSRQRNKLVRIAMVKPVNGTYWVNGEPCSNWDEVKQMAGMMGFQKVRMGAINSNV